jgi:hypothetical protein
MNRIMSILESATYRKTAFQQPIPAKYLVAYLNNLDLVGNEFGEVCFGGTKSQWRGAELDFQAAENERKEQERLEKWAMVSEKN